MSYNCASCLLLQREEQRWGTSESIRSRGPVDCNVTFFPIQLNFKKGDVITITQKLEGGWWEGTLEGKTGWFPSNYVKDAKILGKTYNLQPISTHVHDYIDR